MTGRIKVDGRIDTENTIRIWTIVHGRPLVLR